jgi:hypothetical protein
MRSQFWRSRDVMQKPKIIDPGLREIDDMWGPSGWYLTKYEEVLRADPDVMYHEQRRQQARAIAAARRNELQDALLARMPPR